MNLEYDPFLDDIRMVIVERTARDKKMNARDRRRYSAKTIPYRDPKGQVNVEEFHL